jgi:hypothetical protein
MRHIYVEMTEIWEEYQLGSNSHYIFYWFIMLKEQKNDMYFRNYEQKFWNFMWKKRWREEMGMSIYE